MAPLRFKRARCTLLLSCSGLLLTACGGGGGSAAGGSSPADTGLPPTLPGVVADPTNNAPSIAGTPATSITAGQQYSFQATASDVDGDVLTFSAVGLPAWATLDTNTGWLRGTPGDADAGKTADIVVSVTDGKTITSLATFSVTIAALPSTIPSVPGNAAPTISGSPPATLTANTAYAFTPAAYDADTLVLAYAIANKPSWASFSTATGRLAGTPGTAMVGSYPNIVISVSDGVSSAALPAFSITVTGIVVAVNGAPTISGTPSASVVAGSLYSFMPTASDPDKDILAFSSSGKPAWATFSIINGGLSGTPTVAQVGTYGNIMITASDGKLATSLTAFSISVTPFASSSVTISWTPPTQNTDGSMLTNLAGYYIYYGSNYASFTNSLQLSNPALTSWVMSSLDSTDIYFAMSAYSATGAESTNSAIAQRVAQHTY